MEKKTGKRLTMCDWCVLIAIISLIGSLANPAVSRAVEEKKLTDMVDALQSVRGTLQLYKVEHYGLLPGQRFVGDSVTPEQFIEALTQRQDQESEAYFQQLPENPYADPGRSRSVTCVNDPDAQQPTGREGTAWWFNAATGQFCACDSAFHANY